MFDLTLLNFNLYLPDDGQTIKGSRGELAQNLFVVLQVLQLDRLLELLSVHGVLGVLLVAEDVDIALAALPALQVLNKLVLKN